jgi:hypothetical protein
MRASTTLKATSALLALGSLLFFVPARAGAAGSSGSGGAACTAGCKDSVTPITYSSSGYAYGVSDAPAPNAELFHVKLRHHDEILDFRAFNAQGQTVSDYPEQRKNSENAWFDPNVVRTVTITLGGRSSVTAETERYHCYYEDRHGTLEQATGTCNSK